MSIYDDPTYAEFLKGYIPEPSEPKASGSKRGETYWSDMPTKVGMGTLGLGKMAVNAAVGNDNRVYDFLESELKRGTGELSPEQRRQDAAIAETIADKNKGAFDVVGSMAGNLRGTAGMLAESLPAMFAGGGVGGLLVRGGGALTGAAVGRVGTLAASGVGEGSIMAADVFDKTGSGAAALLALALGTVTGFIPGNVEAALTRKFAGEAVEGVSDVLVPSLAKAGAVAAAKRTGVAVGSEAGQEFIQEGGQALIEQGANGGALDFQSAMKQGVAGAVMGGVMGGGMHTVAGEGSKAAELKDAEKVLADNPTNPVAQAEVALLRAQRDYVEAAPEAREGLRAAVDVAKAAVLAARMPDSRAAQDNLDTARAEAVVSSAGVEGARVAADSVSAESTRSIMESATTDEALQSFADGQQAHSTLTIGATGVQNTATGIKQGAEEILAGHTYDEKAAAADLERTTHEAKLRQQKEQREALKLQQIALKVNQERAKLGLPAINADMVPEATGTDMQLEQAPQTPRPTTRLDAAENAMIARRGPTDAAKLFRQFNDLQAPTLRYVLRVAQHSGVDADVKEYIAALVESRAEPVLAGNQVREFMGQPEPRYTLQISPDQQVVDVVDENGDTFDTYRGNQAVHDATATMNRLNARSGANTQSQSAAFDMHRDGIKGHEVSHTRVPNGNPAFQYAVGRTTELGIDTVFRRRADEAGTYGGWRWETALSRLLPESQAAAQATPSVPSASDIDNLLDAIVDYETSHFGLDESDARQEASNYLHDFQTSTFANIEQDMQSFSADSPHRALAEAVLAKRRAAEPAQQVEPAPAASPGAPAELAATEQAMLDDGYGQVAVRGMYNLTNQDLIDITNDIGAKRSKREHAFEILQNRQNQYIMNRTQFNARENALENALAALAQVSGRTVDQISTMIAAANNQALNNIINNPSAQYRNEQQALARIAVAYKNNTHLGNVDNFITTARRTAPQPEPSRAAPTTAPAAQPRQDGRRRVEADFETRARTALNNGVLDKLGTFWNNVMRGRGQRVFDFNAADMANRATSISGLTQSDLNELKNRYNAELNRRARQWSLDNNQGILTTLTDPIISITKAGSRVIIELHGLGRRGQNPYKIASTASGGMTVNADGHFTTASLEQAPGSAELGYRLGAEIDRMAGMTARADAYLATNNPMRRQMQSVFHDTLAGFGPGHVSPLTVIGNESPQGVPPSVWNRATPIQRIGLNILRAAHSVTENRAEGETAARFLENLQYDSRKRIVAVTDPVSSRGFPKGTVVTDAELDQRLGEVDPTIGRGVTARGRTAAGGVGADTAKLAIFTNTILARIENDPNATIPDSWETRAKQIGREIEGWMFSEAEKGGAKGIDADEAVARVTAMVGENVARVLLDSGMIDFVQTGAELTGETFSDSNGKVQGATTPDGKIILVLDNLSDKTFDAVLSHEAIHATLKTLLGEDTYNALMSRLDTLLKVGEGSQWVKDANARVPAGTNEQDRLEEIAGYAVELHVRGGTRGNPLVQWAKDFMSALRTAIIQNKALPEKLRTWAMQNIQPADLSRMAIAGLKRAAAQREAELKPNPKATSINVGLVVGMGETAETLAPEFVLAEIEKLGVKVGRNNVVDASYEHNGETINETTLVAELDRALTPAEVERLAINTKQQAIPQRVDGVGSLYGPKAAEWGGFSAHEFRELNGRRSDEANRESRARNWDAEIKALMEEHRDPKTTNARRSQINDELRSARMFQRADQEVRYAVRTGQKFSVGASYGTPREGAVSVVGVHFGNTHRNVLNSVAYGKGIKGEEAARLQGQDDIRPRTMFYVDEGNGVIKEPGLGNVGKQVRLNNLYDLREDALNLASNDLNAMERAVMAAGFDGYYRPNYRDMGQGVVVVVGKHDIPVEPYVPGEGAAPAPAYTGNQYAEALAKSKLPGGAMLGREWLVAITGTEFDTPPVRAQLEQRQGERIYRDDLPRFNRGLRYSVAQEAAALEAPVAPELPGTFNILDIGRRTGIERAYEAVRRAIQDKHVTLRRIQQLAKIGSENIRMDTVGALDRLGSKLMAEQKRLVDEPLAKMENLLDKAGFTPDEGRAALDRLLIAAHVKEYNEHIAEINPVKFDAQGNYISGFDNDQHPGSRYTNAEAAETLRELTSGNDQKTLALLAAQKEYRKMIADLQAFAVDRGLETQETIDSWNKKFPNYTPFNRELDIQENLSIGTVPGSQGFSLRSGIARRAMGSGAEIISPLASTMLWGLKTTTRGENAIVARTFLEFAKAFVPNYMSANGELRPMWKVNTVPNARVVKKMNVYRVSLPDGGLSPEFYSREQAENFGTMQQRAWQAANPGVSPRLSGINVEHMYDGEPQNRVVVQPEPNYQNKPNVMIVPVDGENQTIEFDSHSKDAMAIVEAFKGKATSGAATQTMNKVLTPFRMFSRWVMATSTGFNPVFAAFNAARDIQAAAINAGADKIPGWTAADSAKIAAGFIPAAKGIWKQLRAEFDQMHNNVEAPAPVAGSSADWMQRMVAAGGATGIAHSVTDVEAAETQMRRLFGQEAVDKMTGQDVPNDWLSRSDRWITKVGDGFHRFGQGETRGKGEWISKNVVAGIGRLNESAELTTRTLVFKRATELYMADGHDQETAEKMAANISKNISTNFNRRGNATNVINQLFPFFNAAVQGNARLAETLFEKETYEVKKGDHVLVDQRTKLTPYGKKVASLIGTLGAMQALLLMAAGYDDDEVPKHVKDRAFVIPMPGGTYVAIPMPHGFNLILNAGRELAGASAALLSGEPRKMVSHLTDATWGSLAAMSPAGSAGNPVTDWLPALADPFVSIAMNRDAFGRPIAREDMNPLAPTPGFKRAKEGATGTSKALAEGLNWITGGDQDRPGMVSPTPDQIDFLMGFAGGGVAREGMKALQTAGYVAKGALGIEQEALPLHRVPLIGRIGGNTQSPEVIHQKVLTAAKELNTLQAHYKGLRERGEKEEAAAFKAEHPELALQDDFAKLTRGESKQKKERVKLREGGEVGKINAMAEKSETRAQELLRKLEEYRAQ